MSIIVLLIDGVDETDSAVFERCSFDTSMNAAPGSFDVVIRDPQRNKTFSSGKEISLTIDGLLMFGGFVTQVSMIHFAPAADTANLSDYTLRAWNLRGADYNILFDRRVLRDTSNYLGLIDLTAFVTDGAILRQIVDAYTDMSGFDSSGIQNIASIPEGDIWQQGKTLREPFNNLSFFGGAVWYIAPDKTIIYTPFENVTKSWGFSDQPSPPTSIGFRQVEATEDGSYIENDVLIWGGSEFAGVGATVVARMQDSTSESTYGRWQYAETHFGELHYKTQYGVDARAHDILYGPPGADIEGQQKGLRYTQWQFTFTWFSEDVPNGEHVLAGDIMQIDMNTFSVSKLLPLRSLHISFPDGFETDGTHLVQFDGTFGLQTSDPFTLWAYLLKQQVRLNTIQVSPAAVNDSSTTAAYGAIYQGTPTPATNNVTTTFFVRFPYIATTLQVYIGTVGTPGAALLTTGTDFTESDPDTGEFVMTVAPASTKFLYVVCLTQPSSA